MKTLFSINSYDDEGDIVDEAIFLHVSDTTILQFKDIKELEDFADNLKDRTIPEIKSLGEANRQT